MKDLISVDHHMKAVNTAPIEIDGAIIVRLSGYDSMDKEVEAAVMV